MDAEIEIVEVPEPRTDAMVTLLVKILESTIHQTREVMPFTLGDAMSACMHLLVEAGLAASPPAQLRKDAIEALDQVIAEKVGRMQ